MGHIELCRLYLDAYPEAGPAMKNVANLDVARAAEVIADCSSFDIDIPFSAERAAFVVELIAARRALLRATFGE
jgi:hypothetical protein